MLATTPLFRREAKGGGSENVSPNNSFDEGQFPFLQELDECIIEEKKSFDQSSDWSKASETEETRSEAGYSIPYSHGEYSDAGSSSYACSEISGPLLFKGNIMDWNTTTMIEMESKANLKDTSVLSSSSSIGTSYYSIPIESSIAMHSASVTTPPVIQKQEQQEESKENQPSNSDVTLIMEEHQQPILNILVSVPKESNNEQVVASPPQLHIPKKFRSVAARLFRARNEFQMENNPDPMESKEIEYLIKNYQQVSHRLKSLVTSVKTYQEAAQQLQQARANFLRDCDELCMDTAKPHQEFVPRDGHYDSTFRSRIKVSQLFRAAREQLQQFCSDQKTTTTTTTTSEENLYQQQQLLEYVIEWEDIVTADLGQQLYILKKLEKNKTRCEKKNKKLQHWTEVASKDGASISGRFHTRRLVRNQDKLSEALQVYHVKEREIVFLLQQVTKHGWKDLYPLVEATLELEMQRMKEEEDAFGRPFPAAVDTIDSVIGQVEKEDCMLRTLFDVPHSMHGNSWTVLDVLKDRSKPYLFVDDASPYAARVWIAMLEKEADPRQPTGFHLMHVCSALGGKDPGFCLLQQLGVDETPALVHNGNVLSGSASVAEYIDATILHPSNNNNNGSLTPRHPVSRYNMNVFIDHHSKIEAFFFALLDTGDQTSRQSALGLWMLLEEDLNKFPGPYLCGNQFTLADIHIFPFVEHILQVRRKQKKQQHGYSIPSTLQALQSWYDKVSSRPSVQVVIGNRTAQFVESSK